MNKIAFPAFLYLSLLFYSAQSQSYIGPQEEIEKILETSANFSRAYMNGDYDAIANTYTEDGQILPPGADIIQGRASIKERWILPDEVKILLHEAHPKILKVLGDVAFDIGYYNGKTLRKDGSESTWEGKYVIIWKKVGNEWQIYTDMWNSRD